jgi:hypothetical protein
MPTTAATSASGSGRSADAPDKPEVTSKSSSKDLYSVPTPKPVRSIVVFAGPAARAWVSVPPTATGPPGALPDDESNSDQNDEPGSNFERASQAFATPSLASQLTTYKPVTISIEQSGASLASLRQMTERGRSNGTR